MIKRVLEIGHAGRLKLVDEILSDGSAVYNVELVEKVKITCINGIAAQKLFEELDQAEFDILPM
jgi:hypothetical protein